MEVNNAVGKPIWLDEGMLEKALVFLDELREDGTTNMFGATPYVQEWWNDERDELLDRRKAKELVFYWMKTFSVRHAKT